MSRRSNALAATLATMAVNMKRQEEQRREVLRNAPPWPVDAAGQPLPCKVSVANNNMCRGFCPYCGPGFPDEWKTVGEDEAELAELEARR